MGIFSVFKKKKPQSMYDRLHEVADPFIISKFRQLGAANNCAPTSKTSDQKILEIYQQVGSAFREASKTRNEYLPAGYMNTIIFKFYKVYEFSGEPFFTEHLKYEVGKYIQSGLREDYKFDLKLF
jgi:hypothetical protein